MSKFIEFCVITTHEGSELVSDVLWNFTNLGVVVVDVQDAIDLENSGKNWDYVDKKVFTGDGKVMVKAYFPCDDCSAISDAETALKELKTRAEINVGELTVTKHEIDGDIWRSQWKQHFKPLHIGSIVIVPEWIDYTAHKGETIIKLNSDMAFGTGQHETTSMCVEFLSRYVKNNITVADVGCGSGILGITAKKLGAKSVIFTDIDECAISSTEHNIAINTINDVKVEKCSFLDGIKTKFDLIVANIVADALVYFAPQACSSLNNNGYAILSGILNDRVDKVIDAYTKVGFTLQEKSVNGEWTALVVKKVKI